MEIQAGLFPASGPGMLAMPKPSLAVAGPTLRTARERMGLSLQDVAGQTRIAVRLLAAIEEGRFDGFAAPVYAIGFAHSYAQMVGVPRDWITDCLRDAVAAEFGARTRFAISRDVRHAQWAQGIRRRSPILSRRRGDH